FASSYLLCGRAGASSSATTTTQSLTVEYGCPHLVFRRFFAYGTAMLTRRQKEVLDFVSRHIDKHGVAPTLHEIGRHLKLASVATVHKHLRKLEEKGAVRRLTHQSRAL